VAAAFCVLLAPLPLHEEPTMVELYDMMALVVQSCLRLLEPKLEAASTVAHRRRRSRGRCRRSCCSSNVALTHSYAVH